MTEPAPVDYPVGSVKQDPETKAVAVRTALPGEGMAWGVMTVGNGGHYAPTADVESWADLH